MASDDVHDLFGRDDETDSPADEGDERPEGAAGSTEWDELSSLEDPDSAGDPAVEETGEPTAGAPEGDVGDDAGEFGSTGSTTTSFEEATGGSASSDAGTMFPEDDVDESEATTPSDGVATGGSDGGDGSGFELAGSTASGGEAAGADADSIDPDASTPPSDGTSEDPTTHGGHTGTDGTSTAETSTNETTEPTTPSERDVEDDLDDSESAASTPITEDDADESEQSAPTTSSGEVVEDDRDERDPAAAASAGETVGDETDELAPDAGTTSPEGTATEEPAASASGGATTATDASTAEEHDEVETAGPSGPAPTTSKTTVGGGGSEPGTNRLSTGIDALDRAMGGGVPPGRLVLLVSDPGVQSELLVDSVLAQRDTLYVTTDRPDWEVMRDIEPGLGSGEVVVSEHTPDSLLSGLDSLLDELGTSSNFVLDSVNELELVPRNRYRIFLSDVKQRLFDTGSIGLLTGVTVGHESARDLTLRRADVVWRLETRTTGEEIENRLAVPKFRGGAAVTETIKLELTDEIGIE